MFGWEMSVGIESVVGLVGGAAHDVSAIKIIKLIKVNVVRFMLRFLMKQN